MTHYYTSEQVKESCEVDRARLGVPMVPECDQGVYISVKAIRLACRRSKDHMLEEGHSNPEDSNWQVPPEAALLTKQHFGVGPHEAESSDGFATTAGAGRKRH